MKRKSHLILALALFSGSLILLASPVHRPRADTTQNPQNQMTTVNVNSPTLQPQQQQSAPQTQWSNQTQAAPQSAPTPAAASAQSGTKLYAVRPTYDTRPADAYDISQWQGYLGQGQADNLRHEVKFMILRSQGGDLKDTEIDHNEHIMDKAGIPYGVYSYSYYTSPANAEIEAKELHDRSPYANFYANDIEENNAGDTLNASTQAWADEMHTLTKKPVILYSDLSFLNDELTPQTRSKYDTVWVAAYGSQEPDPSYHYDLWQDSSNHYSEALGQNVDSDVFPYNARPLSYWTGHGKARRHISLPRIVHHVVHVVSASISKRKANRAVKYLKKLLTKVRKSNTYDKRLLAKYRSEASSAEKVARAYSKQNSSLRSQVTKLNKEIAHYTHRRYRPSIFDQIPFAYYKSPNVHTVHVVTKGTTVYTANNRHKVAWVKRGTRLTHVHFIYVRYHDHWITRAVGMWKNRKVQFTSNKHYVNW